MKDLSKYNINCAVCPLHDMCEKGAKKLRDLQRISVGQDFCPLMRAWFRMVDDAWNSNEFLRNSSRDI